MGKSRLSIMLFVTFLSSVIYAQVPQKISYQAVIRNNSNVLVVNSSVGMQISILQSSVSGTVVYSETHTVITNANGLVSLEIGNGTPGFGSFSAINWANGPYFVKTETDPLGGTNYTISGTSQLVSVPYAQLAENVINPKFSVSVSDDSTTSLAQTARNVWLDDPNILVIVPETGRYLLSFYGSAYNNLETYANEPVYDVDAQVRVYNNTSSTELLSAFVIRMHIDVQDPSFPKRKYMPMNPSRTIMVNLIQGDQLKIQYRQFTLGSPLPSGSWTMSNGGISIVKIGN